MSGGDGGELPWGGPPVTSSLGARILRPELAASAAGPSRGSSSSVPAGGKTGSSQESQESWADMEVEVAEYRKEKMEERKMRERTTKLGLKYRGKRKRAKPTMEKAEGEQRLADLLQLDKTVVEAIAKASKATLGKSRGAKDDEDDEDDEGSEDGPGISPGRPSSSTTLPPLVADRRAAALGVRQRAPVVKAEEDALPSGSAGGAMGAPSTMATGMETSSEDEEEIVLVSRPPHRSTGITPPYAGPSAVPPAGPVKGEDPSPTQVSLAPPARRQDTPAQDSDEEVSLLPAKPSQLPLTAASQAPATSLSTAAPPVARQPPSSDDEEEICLVTASKGQPLKADSEEKGAAVEVKWGGWATEHRARPTFPVTEEQKGTGPLVLDTGKGIQVPAPINRFLRSYQRTGVEFLYSCAREGRGGIIGDDMGLGKTIQVIAFLAAIMGKRGTEAEDEGRRMNALRSGRSGKARESSGWPTALLICPSSVQANWARELDTWGYFEHALLRDNAKVIDDFRAGRLDVLIASFDGAKSHIDKLFDANIGVVFIDEVHMVKNPRSALCRAMHRLKCPLRFGLTGTAIQNSLNEFWTILDWAYPNHFGRLTNWQELVTEPLRRAQSADARPAELANGRLVAEAFVKNLLPPYFLRRTKDLIKDSLPSKEDNIVLCPLAPEQLEAYKRILEEEDAELIRRSADPCCDRRDEEGLPYARSKCCHQANSRGESWSETMLRYFALLSECANHLALVFPDPADNDPDHRERQIRYDRQLTMVKALFPSTWKERQANDRNGFDSRFCGKWKVLKGLLEQWQRDGDKVLLFSNKQRLLRWLSHFVEMAGYKHRLLDGSTPQKDRQRLCDEFNEDASVFIFLISTKAGGTGLNLTGANRVVLLDPNWNPAYDLQAMDRAYRFGQKRDVHVYRLIARGSFEEVIYGRQLAKQQISAVGYQASEERRIFTGKGDIWSLRTLFSLQETSLTKALIERCDISEVSYELARFARSADVQRAKGIAKDERRALEEAASGLAGKEKDSSSSPVAAILERAGVQDVVRHQHLLGGSRAERAITSEAKKRALEQIENHLGPPQGAQRRRLAGGDVKKEEVMDALSAEAGQGQAVPPLEWLAEHEGCDVAQLAQRIHQMDEEERREYFARAIGRWNGGSASRHGRLA